MDMAKMEDWLSALPSKYTRKTYKSGIKKFEEFYGKSIESLLNLIDEELKRAALIRSLTDYLLSHANNRV